MELINYTGKLNSHEKYLEILNKIENRCKSIEYVLVDDEDTTFVDYFKELIVSVDLKNKWWGTKTSKKCEVYKIKPTKEIFTYLKQYETFCKCIVSSQNGIILDVLYTEFGINDIAFRDDRDMPLLYTTTHEGFITIRDDLI